jgi:hypothetical protein
MNPGIRMSKNSPKTFDGRGSYNINNYKISYVSEIKKQLEILREISDKIKTIFILEGDAELNPQSMNADNQKVIEILLYLSRKIKNKTPNLLLGEYDLSRWFNAEIELIKSGSDKFDIKKQINNIIKINNVITKEIKNLEQKI